MAEFKQMIQGIYEMMLRLQVPVFGMVFTLWEIFLFGALGALVVWFLVKFFK